MAKSPDQNVFAMLDLSGGMQNATSHILRKRIEVYDAINAEFHSTIGSATRRDGYEQVGQTIQYGKDSLYGGVFITESNSRVIAATNSADNSQSQLNYLDSNNYWTNILTSDPDMRFQTLSFLNRLYVAGESPESYQTLTSVDDHFNVSTSIDVYNAPKCKFIGQYNGQLYAINCQVNGVTYKDRIYQSSAPLGAITYVQTDQSGLLVGLKVDSVQYLKVGMSVDIYGAQTSNLKVQNLAITSIDKVNKYIGFAQTNITVSDLDEIWLSGRYNKLTVFWNTDWPNQQDADWFRIPPGEDEAAELTGWTVNNKRLFLYTKNSTFKWDGQNLIEISPTVGCLNHNTLANIGPWTIWLHSSGLWAYNDNWGQLKLLSRAIKPILDRINTSNYPYLSAVVNNHQIYKLSLGQLMPTTTPTTSTSTSSTSTSSTSSSTSSTSTSSTSTSTVPGTSTSTSSTSSSTSSTSTSSTSMSSTSSSTSTSSTSSSTSTSSSSTTLVAGKTTTRLCYDFNLNIFWTEQHNREQRYQFIHEMNGYRKPYFTDENGYLFRDETGNTDAGVAIPMTVELGRTNCGTEQAKLYSGVQVDSEVPQNGILQYSLDGGNWVTLGQVNKDIQELIFPQQPQLIQSRDINFRFVSTHSSDPPVFNGLTVYFIITESIINELGQRL